MTIPVDQTRRRTTAAVAAAPFPPTTPRRSVKTKDVASRVDHDHGASPIDASPRGEEAPRASLSDSTQGRPWRLLRDHRALALVGRVGEPRGAPPPRRRQGVVAPRRAPATEEAIRPPSASVARPGRARRSASPARCRVGRARSSRGFGALRFDARALGTHGRCRCFVERRPGRVSLRRGGFGVRARVVKRRRYRSALRESASSASSPGRSGVAWSLPRSPRVAPDRALAVRDVVLRQRLGPTRPLRPRRWRAFVLVACERAARMVADQAGCCGRDHAGGPEVAFTDARRVGDARGEGSPSRPPSLEAATETRSSAGRHAAGRRGDLLDGPRRPAPSRSRWPRRARRTCRRRRRMRGRRWLALGA